MFNYKTLIMCVRINKFCSDILKDIRIKESQNDISFQKSLAKHLFRLENEEPQKYIMYGYL